MNCNKIAMLVAAGALALGAERARALTFDIDNLSQQRMEVLPGGQFSFTKTAPGGFAFAINDVFDPDGGTDPDTVGLKGYINGSFQIGTINNGPGGTRIASVTDTDAINNTLTIIDENNKAWTGIIDWIDIKTDQGATLLNTKAYINLTGITYSGGNLDLTAMMGGSIDGASATVVINLNPPRTLDDIKANGLKSGYNLDITSAPDGGLTASLLGLSFIGMTFLSRRRK